MKTTRYFDEQVLRKRPYIQVPLHSGTLTFRYPYIQVQWCEEALRSPVRREVQTDGRIRHWVFIPELGKYLRVVTLEDGQTVHNAFPDRDFEEKPR